MEREHLQELAALHSLDALDGDEYTEVQRLLADSDLLRKEISAFRDVAHLLAQIATPALKPPASSRSSTKVITTRVASTPSATCSMPG